MSKVDLSKRYAKSLFAISKESNSQEKIFDQLRTISFALEKKEVKEFINNPNVSLSAKKQAINKIFSNTSFAPELSSFFNLLLDRKRMSLLPEIVKVFEAIVDENNGVTRGFVTSAKPLSKESLALLESKITQVLKKKIVLSASEDPSMIAGVIARVGGWTFDDSLDTQLKKLNEKLLNH